MEQILQIRDDLDKSLSSKDSAKAIASLRSLVSIPMTMVVLQQTHIGHMVQKVRRQFDDPEVVSLGRSLVKKWKKMLNPKDARGGDNNNHGNDQDNNSISLNTDSAQSDSKNPKSNNSISSSDNKNDSNQRDLSSSIKQQQAASTSAGSSNGSKSKFSAPVQTEVPHTNSAVRLKFREMIVQALKTPLPKELQNRDETYLDEDALAARIEDCIYMEFKSESDMKYKNRMRSRILNLKDAKNPYLRLNVLCGEISPERIAKMTAEEMASDELKKERERFTKEAINDHQMSLTTGTRTSEIKCPACKKYDCTYNQMQTRSSDEPMTTFCYCNNCGKRWKFC